MSLRHFLPTNRNAESSLENHRTPTYTSNITTAPTHTAGADSLDDRMRALNVRVPVLSGHDSVDETESSVTDTLGIATPRYSKRRLINSSSPLHFS